MKNIQDVNEYSVPSIDQQKETSNIISDIMLPEKNSSAKPYTVTTPTEDEENEELALVSSYNGHLTYSSTQKSDLFFILVWSNCYRRNI